MLYLILLLLNGKTFITRNQNCFVELGVFFSFDAKHFIFVNPHCLYWLKLFLDITIISLSIYLSLNSRPPSMSHICSNPIEAEVAILLSSLLLIPNHLHFPFCKLKDHCRDQHLQRHLRRFLQDFISHYRVVIPQFSFPRDEFWKLNLGALAPSNLNLLLITCITHSISPIQFFDWCLDLLIHKDFSAFQAIVIIDKFECITFISLFYLY